LGCPNACWRPISLVSWPRRSYRAPKKRGPSGTATTTRRFPDEARLGAGADASIVSCRPAFLYYEAPIAARRRPGASLPQSWDSRRQNRWGGLGALPRARQGGHIGEGSFCATPELWTRRRHRLTAAAIDWSHTYSFGSAESSAETGLPRRRRLIEAQEDWDT